MFLKKHYYIKNMLSITAAVVYLLTLILTTLTFSHDIHMFLLSEQPRNNLETTSMFKITDDFGEKTKDTEINSRIAKNYGSEIAQNLFEEVTD